MPRAGNIALAAFVAIAIFSITAQVASAGEISMITGRVTVNGLPQANACVSGFGSTATTGADGTYVLKFENAGYGVLNASYNGYNTSSGLMVLPISPLIKVRDLDIVIPGHVTPDSATGGNATLTDNSTSTPVTTLWGKVLAPTGVPEPARQKTQLPDGPGTIYAMAGLACLFFIGFAAYLMVRK